jgi:hypothetical protein
MPYWRLLGAVFIGGALRGGAQLVQLETAQAPAGAITGGIAQTGNQAVSRQLGRALDTRPTIQVEAGQVCNVLLLKPLSLPAMWR